jgi:hypothetical protein
VFCEGECPERESCLLLKGYLNLRDGYNALSTLYPGEGKEDELLASLEPGIKAFRDARRACAEDRHEEHRAAVEQAEEAERALAPIVQRILHKQLADLAARASPQARSPQPRPVALSPWDDAPIHPLSGPGAIAGRDPPSGPTPAEAPPQLTTSAIAEAWAAAREAHPDDDAEAYRSPEFQALKIPPDVLAQVIGQPKGAILAWASPRARAETSLNKERIARLNAPRDDEVLA